MQDDTRLRGRQDNHYNVVGSFVFLCCVLLSLAGSVISFVIVCATPHLGHRFKGNYDYLHNETVGPSEDRSGAIDQAIIREDLSRPQMFLRWVVERRTWPTP